MRIPTPVSKEVADAGGSFTPWRPGDYDFEVHDASEEVSKSGNEMVKLTLHVFDNDGNKRTVFDYLLQDEKAQWKCRHFAEAIGVIQQYEAGEIDPFDLVGKQGQLKLRIKPAQGDYPAGNQVQDYIPKTGETKASPRPVAPRQASPARPANGGTTGMRQNDLNDDMPFSKQWQ